MDHHLKPTWYVCFWLLADHPLASSDAPHCWLAMVGADGPKSANNARIRDFLKGGGGGGFYGRFGGWTTMVSNHCLAPSGIWTRHDAPARHVMGDIEYA